LVSPLTVIGLPTPLAVRPPGDEVTVYEVIAAPPLLTGGVNEIVAWLSPPIASGAVGAPGKPTGTTALDGTDGGPVPALFVAVTVNV
jgi:hypothetical protein